jgi:hypothetical protein
MAKRLRGNLERKLASMYLRPQICLRRPSMSACSADQPTRRQRVETMRLSSLRVVFPLCLVLSAAPAGAADLTGTWRGTGTMEGQATEITAAFSADGYGLFEYTNNRGEVRTVELSAPQQFRFVPPGGGVTTVGVESVVKRPGGLSYVLHLGFERTSGGFLDQRYVSEEHDYDLTNEGLRVRVVSRAATYFGNRGGPVGGPRDAEIFEGVLKKID